METPVKELIRCVGGKTYPDCVLSTASESQGRLIESATKDETSTIVSDDVIQVDLQLLLQVIVASQERELRALELMGGVSPLDEEGFSLRPCTLIMARMDLLMQSHVISFTRMASLPLDPTGSRKTSVWSVLETDQC